MAGEAYTEQVAQMARGGASANAAAVARLELDRIAQGGRPPAASEPVRHSDGRGEDQISHRPMQMHQPPPKEAPLIPGRVPEQGRGLVPPSGPSRPTMMDSGGQRPPLIGQSLGQSGLGQSGLGQSGLGQSGPGQSGPGRLGPNQPTMGLSVPGPAAAPGLAPGRSGPGFAGASQARAAASNPAIDAQLPRVRPRVVSARRSEKAAHESLRRSAAVGEMYLNNLLTAGLLDIPNVRVGEMTFDVNPDRKWGRSSTRMFIYLFVISAMAIAGVGTWYWYTEKQRGEDVARHLEEAEGLSKSGAYADIDKALVELRSALKRDPSSLISIARYAEASGVNTLLYGEIPPGEVLRAVGAVRKEVKGPGDEGYRELLVARTGAALATLHLKTSDQAVAELKVVITELRAWLERSPDDRKIRWLEGRALLAAGDRNGASGAFAQSWNNGAGQVLAGIEVGDMLLDEGKTDEAMKRYNAALEKAPGHPLALLGRGLLRAEESRDAGEMMRDVNVGLANVQGLRAKAYRALAESSAHYVLGDYDKSGKSLAKAQGVSEPRFLARVALGHLRLGNLATAAKLRDEIRWYSDTVLVNPLVKQVDAELQWHAGDNKAALGALADHQGLHASYLRGRALFAMGAYKEARAEFDLALQRAPNNPMVQVWSQANRLVSKSSERKKANQELERLGLNATSKAPRTIHGIALALVGSSKQARTSLESSIEDITEEKPNPLEYRAQVALARLDLAENQLGNASSHLTRAVELNGGFLETHDLLGQLLAGSDKPEARRHLELVSATGALSYRGEIAYAGVLAPFAKGDRDKAISALKRAVEKGAPVELLRERIATIDPTLFDAVGIEPKK